MRASRGGAGSAASSVLQRAPAWLGVRTAPAAGGGGAGGAAANGSRGAAHVRAGPGRPRPLAPRAAAALRCRGPGAGAAGAAPGRVRGARREPSGGRQSLWGVLGAQGTKKSKAALAWAGGGNARIAGMDSSAAVPEAEHRTLRKKPN
nr:spidroin-1-like [Taeniopygia guttata]